MQSFGRIIAAARKTAGISQKDLAATIIKEDGLPISPQYLNDIEHDRRNPPSEFIIEQFATALNLSKDYLVTVAGMLPNDIMGKLGGKNPAQVEKALTAFRKVLNKG